MKTRIPRKLKKKYKKRGVWPSLKHIDLLMRGMF